MIDKIRRIKESRLEDGELTFINIIENIELVKSDTDFKWYSNRGNLLFKKNKNMDYVYVSNREICDFYQNMLNFNNFKLTQFLKRMLIKYLNLNSNIIPLILKDQNTYTYNIIT